MSLPPIPGTPTQHCEWPHCTLVGCEVFGFHQTAILIIPEPGVVVGVVNVRWDDDEAQVYWNRHGNGNWAYGLPLPSDPPAEMAREVQIGRRLYAKHTPARELVSAS